MVRTRRVVIVGFSLVAWVAAIGTPAQAVTNTRQAAGSLAKPLTASGFPTSPPAPICGNTSLLSGPAVRPTGAVEIDPGGDINAITQANPPGTTFWLSPGTFTLGSGPFNQIIPQNNDTYIGAPGAIIDGQGVNMYAFTQKASGVTIEYLTIQNFVPPQDQAAVNHDSGSNWTIQYDTIQDIGKAGMNAGPNSITQYSCITANGQTGINGLSGTTNVLIDHNELSEMATGPNAPDPSCGCEAGIKLFGVIGAVITNNWIHNNAAQGVWGDTNAVGFLIQGNYINNNDDEAIFYETSYNAFITDNTILDNALVKGAAFAATGDSFPIAAVYISESGGDSRVFGGKYSTLEISNNDFVNDYGGVTLWEDANRFCGTSGNNAPGSCPIAGAASISNCVQGTINNAPYFADCRWHTQNVLVDNNIFSIDKVALNCLPNASQSANPSAAQCGENSIFSDPGTSPAWTPYAGATVENAITFNQNNHFENNTYTGDWSDSVFTQGRQVSFPTWQDPPFNQDVGSTITPPQTQNAIPVDTATLEGPTGSTGDWVPWFSSTIAQSTAEAHGGTHSLQVGVTASGWGVTLTGFPYFFATPGPKTVSFWAMTTSADSPGTTLEVTFYDSNGNALGTSNVPISALTGTWQEGTAALTAPAATATVGIAVVGTGAVGDTIYLDDFAVSDVNTGGGPTTTTTSTVPVTTTTSTVPVTTTTSTVPATTTTTVVAAPVNALDGNTSTLEGGIGAWVPWYSDTIAQSTAQAHGGAHSLQIGVTQPFGWGVTLNNYPYFPDTPGTKTVSFWAMTTAADSPPATLNVVWLSATGATLGSSNVTIAALTGTWQQGSATLTAPAGTATVETNILGTGAVGDTVYVDDIFVTGPGSTGPTTTTTVPVTTTTVPVTTTTVPVTTTTVPVTTTTVPVTTTTVPVTTTTVPVTTTTVPVTTTTVPVTTTTVPVTTTTVPVTTTTVPVTTTTVPVTTTTVPVTTTTVPVTTTTVPVTTTTVVAAPVNALDGNTSTLEGGIGDWVPWYSDTVAQSTAQAHGGAHSLQVGVTQPFGWGVTLNNYPYFPDTPGTKTVNFWAMTTAADSPAATLNVVWLSSTGAILGSSNVTISALTGTWQQGSATLTAPAGTTTVEVNILGTGAVGDNVYVDDIFVTGPGSTGPTTTTTVPVTTTTVPVTTTTVPVTTTTVPVTTTTVPVTTTTVPVTTTTVPVTTTTVPVTTTTVPVTTTTVPVTTTTVPVTTTTVPATTTTLSINGTTTTVPVTTTTVPVTTTTVPATTTSVPATTTTVPATTTTTVAPPVNALDANTSSLEGGIGDWVPWYSDTVAQSTAQAHSGTHSLQVGVTQPFGWGVTLNNYPYFPDSPGTKTVSFWAMTTSADSPAATMNVVWLSATGAILGSSNVTISALTGTWQKGSATLTAPAGTATVEVNLLGTGAVGDTIYADDFFVSP